MKKIAIILLLFFIIIHNGFSIISFAIGNRPDLHWYRYETKNFIIVYTDNLDDLAKRVGDIAEYAYKVHQKNLKLHFKNKEYIFVTDCEDIANGFTLPTDTIFIYARPSQFAKIFSGNNQDWLTKVVSHEMVHALIMANTKSWLSYISPFLDFSRFPRTIHEGFAQFYAGEKWGVKRGELYLNRAVLLDNYSLGNLPDSGGLLYAQGFSKVKYMNYKFPKKDISKLFKFRTKLGLYKFENAFKSYSGMSWGDFSSEWHKVVNGYYNWRYAVYSDINDVSKRIPFINASYVFNFKKVKGKNIAVYSGIKRADEWFNALYYVTYDKTEEKNSKKEKFTNIKERIIFTGDISSFDVSKDGKKIVASVFHKGKNSARLNDLYLFDVKTSKKTKITSDFYAFYPVFTNDNKIIFVASRKGVMNLYLYNLLDKKISKLTNNSSHIRLHDLYFSDKKLVLGYFDDDKRKFGIEIYKYPSMKNIFNKEFDEHVFYPKILKDKLYFISYKNGLQNIYAYDFKTKKIERLTNIINDITIQDIDNNKLFLTINENRKERYIISVSISKLSQINRYKKNNMRDKFYKWRDTKPGVVINTKDVKPAEGRFVGKFRSFKVWKKIAFVPFPGIVDKKFSVGFLAAYSDILAKNNFIFSFLPSFEKFHNSNYNLIWLNKSFSFDTTLSYSYIDSAYLNYADETLFTRKENYTVSLSQFFTRDSDFYGGFRGKLSYNYYKKWCINSEDFIDNEKILNGDFPVPETVQSAYIDFALSYFYNLPAKYWTRRGFGGSVNFGIADKFLGGNYNYTFMNSGIYNYLPITSKHNIILYSKIVMQNLFGTVPVLLKPHFSGSEYLEYNDKTDNLIIRGIEKTFYADNCVMGKIELQKILDEKRISLFLDLGYGWESGRNEKLGTYGIELNLKTFYGGYAKNIFGNKEEKWFWGVNFPTTISLF